MLKQIAWNTFKTTGNIDTMLELLEVDKTMNNIETKIIEFLIEYIIDNKTMNKKLRRIKYGTYKNERINFNAK